MLTFINGTVRKNHYEKHNTTQKKIISSNLQIPGILIKKKVTSISAINKEL